MMTEYTLEMLERCRSFVERSEAFDATPEMMRLTLHIVGRALLTTDLTNQADSIGLNMAIANGRFGQADIGMLDGSRRSAFAHKSQARLYHNNCCVESPSMLAKILSTNRMTERSRHPNQSEQEEWTCAQQRR